MTFPITPLGSIHVDPFAAQEAQLQLQAAWNTFQAIFSQLPAQIITAVVNAILSAFGLGAFEGDFDALIARLNVAMQAIPGAVISGYTTIEQDILNAIGAALGHPAPPNRTPADIQGYLANIPGSVVNGVTQDWATALNALQLPDPLALIQQVPQSIPAFVRDAEGGLHAVGTGMTRGVDGAMMFVEDGLTHIAKQDGGLLALQQIAAHIVHVSAIVSPIPGATVGDVIHAGQTAHTALTGAIEQAGATVENDIVAGAEAFGGVVSGTAGQLEDAAVNAIGGAAAAATQFGQALGGALGALLGIFPGGSPSTQATPAQIQDAALAVRTLLANHTADIANLQALLSGGSSGMNVLIPMSGVLPAGFTSMGALAPAGLSAFINSAVYTAAAAPTNAQSVSAIWSANPPAGGYILILNADTALTTYNYLKIYVTSSSGFYWVNFELGSVVSGVQATLDSQTLLLPSRPNPTSIPNNAFTFECDATGLDFNVLYNGVSFFTFTDPGGHVVPGAGQRSFGWATSEASLPGAIIQWGASSPAATIGSGFVAHRSSTSGASFAAGGTAGVLTLLQLPTTWLDTVDRITSDITFNAATNTATVHVSGWYDITVCQGFSTSASVPLVTAGVFHNGLWVNQAGAPGSWASGIDVWAQSTISVYCVAGDTLSPGVGYLSGTFTASNLDSSGQFNYFSVVLANCGTIS